MRKTVNKQTAKIYAMSIGGNIMKREKTPGKGMLVASKATMRASQLSRHQKEGRVWAVVIAGRRASQKEGGEKCKGPEVGTCWV